MAAMEAKVVLEMPQDLSALYVGDLDSSVTEEELLRFFDQTVGFVSVKLCMDLLNQQSLGYGYVNYTNPDDGTGLYFKFVLLFLNFGFLSLTSVIVYFD